MENKTIKINGAKLDFKLKRVRRIKYLRLAVRADSSVLMTAPRIYPLFLIKHYINEKLSWILESVAKQKNRHGILSSLPHSREEVAHYKKMTKDYLERRLPDYNQQYGFVYNRVAIRNQGTRWGSCSSKKNLNFNYRLCLLSPDLADYIIVHELCHLGEMNHSRRFWALVAKTFPDYKLKIKMLRKIG